MIRWELGWILAAISVAGLPIVANAQLPDIAPPSDESLVQALPTGHELEGRVDGDLNGDGQVDVAYVGRSEESRTLYIRLAYRTEVDFGHEPFAAGALDPYPQGGATLKVAGGVLLVEDLTGGTTATLMTYRLRYEPKVKRMRLIGLDLKTYSRTYAHEGVEWSWNLITGATTRRNLPLIAGGGGYAPGPLVKSKRTAKPIYLEELPDSEETEVLLGSIMR